MGVAARRATDEALVLEADSAEFVHTCAMRGDTDRSFRSRRSLRMLLSVALTAAGCAAATFDPTDASGEDAAPSDALGDSQPMAPSDAMQADATPGSGPPSVPGGAGDLGHSGPDAPPTAPPTAPTAAPPGSECQTDEDCGGGNRICFGNRCVVDPAAPTRVGDGACTNDADETRLSASIDWRRISEVCGLMCVNKPETCVDTCVAGQTGLSARCAGCYGAWLSCISSFCLFWCAVVDDADCGGCRADFCDRPLGVCGGYDAPRSF